MNGIPDPVTDPGAAALKTPALLDVIRQHQVVVLTETRTNELGRLMHDLRGTHALIHANEVPTGCAGLPGYGVAVLASLTCADQLKVFAVSEHLQCIWIQCNKAVFGLDADVMMGAVYINPMSGRLPSHELTEVFSSLADEVARALQVTPHLVLCGDFNAHVAWLSEVTDVHAGLLLAHPALHKARRCELRIPRHNHAGKLLIELCSLYECVLGTGRVWGDGGQRTCVKQGQMEGSGSRPDHVVMSSDVFGIAERVDIGEALEISDHCTLSVTFGCVNADVRGVDRAFHDTHVCKRGGCGTKMRWTWRPERQLEYAEVLLEQTELHEQFEQAVANKDIEGACFCLRSMIDQAASDRRVGMTDFVSVCAHLRRRGGAHSPPWFDAECAEKRRLLREAVRSGQAAHACDFLRKDYKVHVRWAKRVFTRLQRDVFLGLFKGKDPELHAFLRKTKQGGRTPVSQKRWDDYLKEHFTRPRESERARPGPDIGRDLAVPIGRGRDVAALLRQQREGVSAVQPDAVEAPDLDAFQGLVLSEISKMNAKASPGFDVVTAPFIKHAVVIRPCLNGRGVVRHHCLSSFIAQLFQLMYESARIPDDWKKAKLAPLYKKGAYLDPNNYRMLAVSGTMYRVYTNVLRALVTDWCMRAGKIPDTQFGFCPGRSTMQPCFILRHLQHAAGLKHAHLHAAFIDFKQAYDTIPRQALWQHLQSIRMPTPFLAAIQDMYKDDEYVLMDGDKIARVKPTVGVKQGCPLSPLLFSLYVSDVDYVAEGCEGAMTGTENFRVSHLMFADDLTLLSNCDRDLQKMLDKLRGYAERKHLIINVSKSEVVHFNSRGEQPKLKVGSAVLQCKDSFKYLGMMFYKTLNMERSSEYVNGAIMAASGRIHQFVGEYELESSLQPILWLGKTYLVPAALYGSQVWGTAFVRQGQEFASALQVRHLAFLKRTLGVKRTTCNWSLLRECGHLPLQFNWFKSVVRMYNSMLESNSTTVRKVLQADVKMHPRAAKCWTAQMLDGFQGLHRCDDFVSAVRNGAPIKLQDFTDNLRLRIRGAWNTVDDACSRSSVSLYKDFFGVPFDKDVRAPVWLPHYMYQDHSKHVMRNVSRFRLRAHTLLVDRAIWSRDACSPICDKCDLQEVQDEAHVLFRCTCPDICQLRRKYAPLFQHTAHLSPSTACVQFVNKTMMYDFLSQANYKLSRFVSELMDLCETGLDQSQTDQPTFLAEGP